MAKKVGSYEAKTHLPRILEEIEKGQTYTITRRGIPIAMLIPAPKEKSGSVAESVAKIRKLREENKLGNLEIKKLIKAGRR